MSSSSDKLAASSGERRLLKRIADSLTGEGPVGRRLTPTDSDHAFYGDDYFIITEGGFRGRDNDRRQAEIKRRRRPQTSEG